MKTDIIIGLSRGDEGKGCVTYDLVKRGGYDACLRFNGGPNAGHTIYVDGQKVVTHSVPTGVIAGIPSIIGPGSVLNVPGFFQEMGDLEDVLGGKVWDLVRVDRRVHIITDEHLKLDAQNDRVGSTKRGISPTYTDKAARIGIQACDVGELSDLLVDVVELFKDTDRVLCEGAQGFYLDDDMGNYPYVSSPSLPGMVNKAGVPLKSIDRVWGVAKAYDTYVGTMSFEPLFDSPQSETPFKELRRLGNEFGATTGRPRQCNWLNLDELLNAIRICSVTDLVINKCDVLEQLGQFAFIHNGKVKYFSSMGFFKDAIEEKAHEVGVENIHFSSSPERI